MPSFHVRLSDEEDAMLDRLTEAVREQYRRMSITIPRFAQVAAETTRSSALRDLLQAWDHGQADTAFGPQDEAQKP